MPRRTNAVIRVPVTADGFAAAVEGLVSLNVRILEGRIPGRHRFPPLRRSDVVYKREKRDVWRDIQQVFESGWGDCEDLASIVVAQLRFSGRDPGAYVDVYKSGPKSYHAIVVRGDGTTEDISRELGMLPKGRSPYGVLGAHDMQHNGPDDSGHDDASVEGEWDLEELGGEWDMDELGWDEDDYVGRGKRHGWGSRLMRRHRLRKDKKDPVRAYGKRRRRAKKLLMWCVKYHKRKPLGDGAWVGIGDDPLAGDPNMTFDLYKSGRGWSGIVRIPTSLIKAGRRQAIIAKTTRTRIKRKRRRGKPRKRRRTRARRRKPTRRRKRRSAKRRTVSKAIHLASKIANLPGVSALIPPQAATALKLLKGPIGKLATAGVKSVFKKLKFW